MERTCPSCNGAGQIVKNPCKSCHGQGRVERERQAEENAKQDALDRQAAEQAERERQRVKRKPVQEETE